MLKLSSIVALAALSPSCSPHNMGVQDNAAISATTVPMPAATTADAGDRCEINACLLCPPPAGLCLTVGCSGIPDDDGNVCLVTQRAPGEGCASGVGLCNTAGECVVPGGRCMTIPVSWVNPCKHDAECEDGNPCTQDSCMNALGNGWCNHVRQSEGLRCGPDMVCHVGACCEVAPL